MSARPVRIPEVGETMSIKVTAEFRQALIVLSSTHDELTRDNLSECARLAAHQLARCYTRSWEQGHIPRNQVPVIVAFRVQLPADKHALVSLPDTGDN